MNTKKFAEILTSFFKKYILEEFKKIQNLPIKLLNCQYCNCEPMITIYGEDYWGNYDIEDKQFYYTIFCPNCEFKNYIDFYQHILTEDNIK